MKARTLSAAALLALSSGALAQPTAFTYQGLLKNGVAAANGLHDLRFRLWDAPIAGNPLGSVQCVNNVAVTEGLFTTTIDFGQQYAGSAPRFLEIEVRADTGLDCSNAGGFVVLFPRQPLTPTPQASHANAAFSLDAADGSPQSAVMVDNAGNVGIGTTAPSFLLHLRSDAPVLALHDNGPANTQVGYLTYRNAANAESAWVGFGTPGSPQFSMANNRPGGDLALYAGTGGNIFLNTSPNAVAVNPTGSVGIGTATPAARLDVRGDIRLGSSGQFHAPAGEESLRIIRGIVGEDASILGGSGFTVSRLTTGDYLITFTTAFSALPSVTAIGQFVTLQCPTSINTFSVSTSSVRLFVRQVGCGSNESLTNQRFQFIAVGPR